MTSKTVAKRYARALLGLSGANIEGIKHELHLMKELLKPGAELRRILEHPLIPEQDKKQTLLLVLEDKTEVLLLRFLELLIHNRRINVFHDIVEIYDILSDEAMGIVRAKVRTPFALSAVQQEAIRQKLAKITKQLVIIDIEMNLLLIGGITIQIGDKIIDGSIQGRLSDLKEKLLEIA